jgi:hypothetical protein
VPSSLVSTPRSCGLLWPRSGKRRWRGLLCVAAASLAARCPLPTAQTATPLQSSLLQLSGTSTTPTPAFSPTAHFELDPLHSFIPFPSLFFPPSSPTPLFQHHALDPNHRRRPNPPASTLHLATYIPPPNTILPPSKRDLRNAVLAHARTVLVANWPAATQQYTHHPSMTRDQKQMHNQQQRNQVAL